MCLTAGGSNYRRENAHSLCGHVVIKSVNGKRHQISDIEQCEIKNSSKTGIFLIQFNFVEEIKIYFYYKFE